MANHTLILRQGRVAIRSEHWALTRSFNISLYWLTNTGTSSGRIYWETSAAPAKNSPITVPAAVTIFPGEVYRPPKQWLARAYQNLISYNRVAKGGHFAAWEEPELFSAELRSAFRSLR
ncbi:hypothetical protein [Cupriavidus necator]